MGKERRVGGGVEKHQCESKRQIGYFLHTPTRDQAPNQGIPEQESKWQPFGAWGNAQKSESHTGQNHTYAFYCIHIFT